MIRLLVIVQGINSGVGYHRLTVPYTLVSDLYGDEIQVTFEYDIEYRTIKWIEDNFDVVTFSGNIGTSVVDCNKITGYLQAKGIPVIQDVDDYWKLDKLSPFYEHYNKCKHGDYMPFTLSHVKYVTTTTERFRDEIIKINPNVTVLPNLIDTRIDQFKSRPTKSKRIRIGLTGGNSHFQDNILLQNVIKGLSQEVLDKVQFVLCGINAGVLTPGDVNYETERILTRNYADISPEYKEYLDSTHETTNYPNSDDLPYFRVESKHITKYGQIYNYIDILLVPLRKTIFNNMKSPLKLIEAAAFDKAVIASNTAPYSDLIDYEIPLCKNDKEWIKAITELVLDDKMREQVTSDLRCLIDYEFNPIELTEKRFEFIKEVYGTNTYKTTEASTISE